MKHRNIKVAAVVAVAGIVGAGAVAFADGGRTDVREQLSGYDEVPALSTTGGGQFRAALNERSEQIKWELSFGNLETDVTQAHIHFENATNNGPIVVFLCSNLGNGPAGTQACPAQGGTISGTIGPENVGAGAAAQGIAAGEFAEVVTAIRSGAMYVNVHSVGRPGGEIRAQLHEH
ncbi:MAG: CHRD domain-containing protein [Ilumatobacteraceae bacterium]